MLLNFWLLLTIGCGAVICNNSPIIGVLTQEAYSVAKYFPNENIKSYIAASYVKYLESAGARIAPIWIGRDEDYYKKVINFTNGIFLPGGATWFNQTDGYAEAGQLLYNRALEINKNGDYYPIWGTCLGMELLAQVAIGGTEIRAHCSGSKLALPLDFKEGYTSSKLFSKAPKNILHTLKTEKVTVNSHQFCLTETNFTLHKLSNDWRVMSTNRDYNNLEFISSYESIEYPFYAVQFHPEKNPFEFKSSQNSYVDHTKNAILVSQYFANFFVEETRKSTHSFPDWETEQEYLIYNYPARFTGLFNSSYAQMYTFTDEMNQSL